MASERGHTVKLVTREPIAGDLNLAATIEHVGSRTGGDTIFAAASGAGRAAITVVRVSGPGSGAILARLAGVAQPVARRASLRRLHDRNGAVLDHAMVIWLPAPASYTGEDSCELHLHGGLAVLEGVSLALVDLGARPAEPGQFTRRAFLNGRLELTEAEAIVDLIAAETTAQRDQALRQMDGALAQVFDALGGEITSLLAEQEALIDFPEDAAASIDATGAIRAVALRLREQIADDGHGERLRAGLTFAVIGPPNAGKSSLVNALAGRQAAIVDAAPGTTRDVIEVRAIFGGVPVTLLDTAGLRDSADPVEAEGIRRARARSAEADLVMLVHEAGLEDVSGTDLCWLRVANKIDLRDAGEGWLGVSVLAGTGMRALQDRLDEAARGLTQQGGPAPLTRARHRAACQLAAIHLDAAERALDGEIRAEELRLALAAVGQVSGKVGVEDVLDVVFSQFCIGK